MAAGDHVRRHAGARVAPLMTSALALRTEATLMLPFGMVVLALVTFAAVFGFVIVCERV